VNIISSAEKGGKGEGKIKTGKKRGKIRGKEGKGQHKGGKGGTASARKKTTERSG